MSLVIVLRSVSAAYSLFIAYSADGAVLYADPRCVGPNRSVCAPLSFPIPTYGSVTVHYSIVGGRVLVHEGFHLPKESTSCQPLWPFRTPLSSELSESPEEYEVPTM